MQLSKPQYRRIICFHHFKVICYWLGKRNRLNSRKEKALTKSDLIEKLARLEGINQKAAEFAVNAVFESMAKTMVKGGRVEIRGFGSLRVKDYDGFEGRNPKTGEPINIAAKRLPLSGRARSLKKGWTPSTMRTSKCR